MSMTIPNITITAEGDHILLSGNLSNNKPSRRFLDKPVRSWPWSWSSTNTDAIITNINGKPYEISKIGLANGLEKFISQKFAQSIVSNLVNANQDNVNKAIRAAIQMQASADALAAIESPGIVNTDKIRKAFEIFVELIKKDLEDVGAAQGILDEIVEKLGSILCLTKIQLEQAYSTTLIRKDTILICKDLETAYNQTPLLLKANPKILNLKDKVVELYKNLPLDDEKTAQHSIGKKIIEYSLYTKIIELESKLNENLQEYNVTTETVEKMPLSKYDPALLNIRIYQRKLDQINRDFCHIIFNEIQAWAYFNRCEANFINLLKMASERLKKIEFVKKFDLLTQLIFCDFSEGIFNEEYQKWYKNEIESLTKEFNSSLDEYYKQMNWRALSDIMFLIDEHIDRKNSSWDATKEILSEEVPQEDPFYKACNSAIEKIKTFVKKTQKKSKYNLETFYKIKSLLKENKNFKDQNVYISKELEQRKKLIKKIACDTAALGAVRLKAIKGGRRVLDSSLIPSIGFRTAHTVLLLPEEKIVVKEPDQRALAEEKLVQKLFSFFSHLIDPGNLVLSSELQENSLDDLQVDPLLEYGFKYAQLKDTPALQRLFDTLSLDQKTIVDVLRSQKTAYEDLKEGEFKINGGILKFEEIYQRYHEGKFNDNTKLEDRFCDDEKLNKKAITIREYKREDTSFQLALDYNSKLNFDKICFIPNLPSGVTLKELHELNGEIVKLTKYDLKKLFLCHLNGEPILLCDKNGKVIQKSVSDILQKLNEKQNTTFGKYCALSWKLIFPILIEAKLKSEKDENGKINIVFDRYVPLHGELLVKPFIQNMQIVSDLISEKAQKMVEKLDVLLDMLSDSSIMCVILFLLLGAKDLHLANIGLALKANATFKQFKNFSFSIGSHFPFSIERNIDKISLGKLIFLYLFGEIKANAEIIILLGEDDREKKVKIPLNQFYLLKKEACVEIIKLKAGISPLKGEGINEELKKKLNLSKNKLFSFMDAIEIISVFFDTDRIFSYGNDFCSARNSDNDNIIYIPFRHAFLSSQKFIHKRLSEWVIANLKNRNNFEPALDWLRNNGAFKQEKTTPRMSVEQLDALDERFKRFYYYLDTYESLSKAVNGEKLKEFVEKSNVLDMERMEYYLKALKDAATDDVKLSQINTELLDECYPTFFNVAKAIYHKLANVVSLIHWINIKDLTKKHVEKEKNKLGAQVGSLSMNRLLEAALAKKFDSSTVQWRVTEQLRKDVDSPPTPWPPL